MTEEFCPKCGAPVVVEEWPGYLGEIARCMKGHVVRTKNWTNLFMGLI